MCVCVLLRLLLSSRLQTLQQHHHPDVSKAAALISSPLLQQEDDISERLETTNFQVSLPGAFQDLPGASRTFQRLPGPPSHAAAVVLHS